MPELFDPNTDPSELLLTNRPQTPLDSMNQRAQALKDRKAEVKAYIAEQLRRSGTPIKGEIIGTGPSAQWVGPHWTEQLAPVVGQMAGRYAQDKLDAEEVAQGVQQKADLRDTLTQLSGSPSPADDLGGGPALPAPTGADRRVLIARLMDNPAAGQIGADMLKDDLISAPIRADAERVRVSESQKAIDARKEAADADRAQRAEDAKRRSEDTRLSIEQRAEASRQHAALMSQMQADRAAARSEARADRNANRTGKPLPQAVHKELSGLEDSAATLDQLSSTFRSDFAGPTGYLAEKFGPYFPGASDDAAQWWKTYKKQSELTERHALFGASLTPGEQASWRSADISPGMKAETITKNLATRKAIADKVYANGVDRYEKGGYPGVRNAYNPATVRSTGGATGDFGGAPAPALTVVRTGTVNGRKVQQMSDGSTRYAQ